MQRQINDINVAHVSELLSGKAKKWRIGPTGATRSEFEVASVIDNGEGKYRYFYDCEFIEDGTTIDLVSIAVVDEHGREFYAISTEFNPDKAIDWVRQNVLTKLPSPGSPLWMDRRAIRDRLYEFLVEPVRKSGGTHPGDRIELWAWFGAYDHVVFAQLWGAMPDLPRVLPRMTKDLRQRWDDLGRPTLPAADGDVHDALADAKLNLKRWDAMETARRMR